MKLIKNAAVSGVGRIAMATGACSAALMMAGCAGFVPATSSPTIVSGIQVQGTVFGGQQPIVGAAIHVYAASTSAYAGTNTDLLTSAVTTVAGGSFSIASKFTCTTGQQIYVVANGGNPGSTQVNPQIGLMTALGPCEGIGSGTKIAINEATTVATAFALSPFMSSSTQLGSTSTNVAGLTRAFSNVNKLVDVSAGIAPGPALAAGATAPVGLIYAISDILASCVNSVGGTASGTTCGNMFALVTPNGGTAPTDTIGLALAMAKNPALNVKTLYNTYITSTTAFPTTLTSAPNDWTMSINYTSGFNTPKSTTVDARGNVWVANSGTNSVTVLAQTGSTARTITGSGLTAPSAIAIDSNGNAFVANTGGSTVSAFTNGGVVFGAAPFAVGTAPSALAFDATGNLFVANSGSNSVSVLNTSDTLIKTLSTGVVAPNAVAIDAK
jgi:YVTN family beta-propeller protein